MPAFAQRHGHPNAAGVLLALLNAGALAGVLVAVRLERSDEPVLRYARLSTLLAVGALPAALATSLVQMAATLILAGVLITPTAAASYVLMDRVSPPGCRTEAFTWLSTSVAAGTAVGSAVGGVVTQQIGAAATFAVAFASVAAGAAVATAAKTTLKLALAEPRRTTVAAPARSPLPREASQVPRVRDEP